MSGFGISRRYVLAAGGTGGHMIPAHALARELVRRGHEVALVTDDRGARIPGLFEGTPVHILPAGRLQGGPLGWLKAARQIMRGRGQAGRLYATTKPTVAVGFGGYPALPALLAARSRRIPTLIHEQNAVLGRVNRLLARGADAIATAYPDVQRMPRHSATKTHLVGNPVRDEILALRDQPYRAPAPDGELRILVTGGSQGASILSAVVPEGLGLLPEPLRARLEVTQQCRAEDIEAVRARYASLGIEAKLETYISNMPEQLARAHLVIGRAGASTIAELTVAGRPAILIPLPSATDDHQTFNVREMTAAGGARAIAQRDFTPATLAQALGELLEDGEALACAAASARAVGRPDATRDLADLVESLGRDPAAEGVAADEAELRPAPRGAYA